MNYEKIMEKFIKNGAVISDNKGNIPLDADPVEGLDTIKKDTPSCYNTFIVTGNGTYAGRSIDISGGAAKFYKLETMEDDVLCAQKNHFYILKEESKMKFDSFEKERKLEFFDAFSSFNRRQKMENKIIFAFKIDASGNLIKVFEDINVERPWDNLIKR